MVWSQTNRILETIVKSINEKLLFARIMSKRYLQDPPGGKKFKRSKNLSDLSELRSDPVKYNCHNLHSNHSKTNTMQRTIQQKEFCTSSKPDVNVNQTVKNKVEYLDTPIKSQSDKKEYRVIKLPNGLTALLISDMHSLHTLGGTEDDDKKSTASSIDDETEEETEDEISECDEDSEDETGSESDSSEDERTSSKRSKNSKKDEKMAACGLSIGVGSFSDPPEIQGLAHFLEHMVFMGSEKYPKENEFDSFLTKRGGFDNAYTDLETTTFYFDVLEQHLLPALDRFAQFFISPLMKRDAISREREAVDSEFQMALPSDDQRIDQLFASLARKNHPVNKFAWGNLTTLRDSVTEDKLYEELHKFRKRHYSAHRMKLAVQARLPLDTLEEFVTQCFSDVPNNGLPAEDFSEFKVPNSFHTPLFRSIHKIKPVNDLCEVTLTWAMTPMFHLYKSKAREYVCWILGHEGKGSLISYLRKKMWCLGICSDSGESGFEHNSTYSLLSFTLALTDEGHTHLEDVLDASFSYINMIRKAGPQESIYRELRQIKENAFRFVIEENPVDYVQDLCDDMHIYPPLHYVAGGELYFEYNPDAIQTCLDSLTADSVNIMIMDKELKEDELDKTEPWFKTKYTNTEIPEDWINRWKEIAPLPEFHLPLPNVYIPDDFSLIPIPADSPSYPVKVHQDEILEIWYRPDPKFRLPECFALIHFVSPIKNTSPHNAALMDLFVRILEHQLAEELYPASTSHLNTGYAASNFGVVLQVNGYNQKLPLVIKTYISYMAKCADTVTEDLFNIMKRDELMSNYNYFIKPSLVQLCVRQSIETLVHWSAIDKYPALFDVDFEQFKNFAKCFLKHLYIQCLVQGNITMEETVSTIQSCVEVLRCKELLPNTVPRERLLQIPLGTNKCRVRNFNKKDANSVVINYYQSGPTSIKSSVITQLIITIMEEPLYNQLRTREQLGYDVSCYVHENHGILGFSVTVYTQANKYTTHEVDARIEEFLKSFGNKLKEMSKNELDTFKEALIKEKRCVDVQLKEEVERNWREIANHRYIFDRVEREIVAIEAITIEDLRTWLADHTTGGNNHRKLSIHVVGTVSENLTETNETLRDSDVESDGETLYPLEYIKDPPAENAENLITDIAEFKNKLYVYPVEHSAL